MTETTDTEAGNKPRRKRGELVQNGIRLDAPKREGWVRRWVTDTPTRMRRLEDLGYQKVQDRAGTAETRTDSLGTNIHRLAGRGDNGSPDYLVLMETPIEEYEQGVIEKDAAARAVDAAIQAGRDTTGQMTNTIGESKIASSR